MFTPERSAFAAKVMGMPEGSQILVASVNCSDLDETDLLEELGFSADDEENDHMSVSKWQLTEALNKVQSSVKLPEKHFKVGLAKPGTVGPLTFAVVDFTELYENE